MIIRTRRRNESLLRRLVQAFQSGNSALHPLVQPQELFEAEIAKETDRSNRRSEAREFALITFNFSDRQAPDKKVGQLAHEFISRLRISDTIGWFDFRLAVLLPETGKDGALGVANNLAKIAANHGINVETNVSIYPWDDKLASIAKDLHSQSGYTSEDDDFDGSGFGQSTRTDRPHAPAGPHVNDSRSQHDGEQDSLNFSGIGDFESSGTATATATLPEAKVMLQPSPRLDTGVGTGTSIMFQSERTPIWKRGIDVVGAGIGIMLLSPVFIAAAVAIKVSAPGPVFFRQMREGKDGKPFGILKFRTMVIDAEAKQADLRAISEQDGPAFKLKDDPRVTKVGKYLRKSCIDELPQLFNVLFGQMSLVGPRPLPVGESHQCSVWQRRRLSVLPGCTCIWQAHGGRDIPFSEWMRMDMEYIQKRSFFYDLKLIVETACIALLHKGSV